MVPHQLHIIIININYSYFIRQIINNQELELSTLDLCYMLGSSLHCHGWKLELRSTLYLCYMIGRSLPCHWWQLVLHSTRARRQPLTIDPSYVTMDELRPCIVGDSQCSKKHLMPILYKTIISKLPAFWTWSYQLLDLTIISLATSLQKFKMSCTL